MEMHSPIGASSMYRWKNCPGSVNLCKGIRSVSSSYAEEGTRAHELAAKILNGADPNQVSDNAEMLQAVVVYTDAVFQEKRNLDYSYTGNLFLVEHGFKLTQIHEQAYGTADCVIYDVKRKKLTVFDYKHGAGISVEVEENDQLLYYALGAMLSLNLSPKTVEIKIVQPRCPHPEGVIRSYQFEGIRILDFYSDLELAVARTQQPNAELRSGGWCRFCPGAGVCPEIRSTAQLTAKKVFAPTQAYDPQDLSETLEKLPLMEAFITQVREFAYAEAMRGRVPPGYKLVKKRPTRKWLDQPYVVPMISKLVGPEAFEEPKMKSPAQMEKFLEKQKAKDVIKQIKAFILTESSGLKLARLDEPGEPIMLDAKSVFEKLTE